MRLPRPPSPAVPANGAGDGAALATPARRRVAIALLVAVAFFMENLDATVIATAAPAIAASFGVAPEHLSVGISAYLVALTVFIPISGWAADRYGARTVFTFAIVVFTLASMLCAGSSSLPGFIAARILQGMGGAMMVPVGRLVVLRDTPKHGIVRAIAVLTWPALVAPVLGPPLGGWISTYWGWRWIFLLNVPLGAAVLIAALILIRDIPTQRVRFDLPGFTLSGLGVLLLMTGIELASRSDLGNLWLWPTLLCGGVALLCGAAWHLRHSAEPLFDLAPLRIPTFRVTVIGGSLFRTAIGSAPFLLPLMFQLGFGYSAVEAGNLLLWLFAGNLCMKPATTWIMQRFGFRRVLIVNGLVVAAGFAACALLQANTPKLWVVLLMFGSGMARSMQFTALNTLGFADIPQAMMRDATTLFSVLQQMNAGMGIAIGAVALSAAQWLLGAPTTALAQTADFQLAFWLLAALALSAVADSLWLSGDAGNSVLQRSAAD